MEKFERTLIKSEFIKIDNYKGHNVYTYTRVPREDIAHMMPNNKGVQVAIVIRPDAYAILKARPDYLERIYEHELQHNVAEEGAEHGKDKDILQFLKDNGYDFGDFEI